MVEGHVAVVAPISKPLGRFLRSGLRTFWNSLIEGYWMTLSVIMAAYNVERYIDEAIQSVLSQKGVSCELLIGDDASTDGTWERIRAYGCHPRVRAWRFLHGGAGKTWNGLVARALGRYMAICDADDVMLPGHLERGASILDKNHSVGVAFGDLLVLEEETGRASIHRNQGPHQTWDLVGDHVWHPGTIVRSALMRQLGGYRVELGFKYDYDLFLRLAEETAFQKIHGEPRYLYRRRAGSLSDRPILSRRQMNKKIRREAILRRYGYRVPW
jgi:glycosyltransferase involved in cell wall biosynthesis